MHKTKSGRLIKDLVRDTNSRHKIRAPYFLYPEEVLPYVTYDHTKTEKEFFGNIVKLYSNRLLLFKRYSHNLKCVTCGIEGEYFAVERDNKSIRYHVGLYGVDGDNEVLMTKDHIIPFSLGGRCGKDGTSNLQIMCEPCNIKKGNSIDNNSKLC